MNSPRVPADLTPAMARGGTFVRPGAFAWGRPGAADTGACTTADSAAAGAAVVEDALAVAVKDPDRLTDLLDELRRGRLWVPLPEDGGPVTDGSAVQLPTVTYLGTEFVPAFTSARKSLPGFSVRPLPGRRSRSRNFFFQRLPPAPVA